jgi:arginine decarboxylase
LALNYDYHDWWNHQSETACDEAEVDVPTFFTELVVYCRYGGAIYQILYQKQQNDREKWNMIDLFHNHFYQNLGNQQTFYHATRNQSLEWYTYERVLLGEMTCDSDDYYNLEQNMECYLSPKYNKENHYILDSF